MRIAVVVLAATSLTLAAWVQSISHNVGELAKSVEALSTKVNEKTTTAGLELPAKCSEQARKLFLERGFNRRVMAQYANHYNSRLNKCFVQISDYDVTSSPGTSFKSKYVLDAFEGKEYGTFSFQGGKRISEASVYCEVAVPSGEPKLCNSESEFNELVKIYMEGP